MTPILQALEQGYSEEDVLKYIQRLIPKISPSVQKATSQGYNGKQILGFINRMMEEKIHPKGLSPHEIEALNKKRYNQLSKDILGTAAIAGGGALLARQIPRAIKGIVSAAKGIGPQPMGGAPVQPSPPINPNISPQEEARIATLDQAKRMTPEFRQYSNKLISEGKEKPLEEMLSDFEKLQKEESKKPLAQKLREDFERTQQEPKEEFKPQKGHLVAAPNGIQGQLESIREKEALIKDDSGKLHKIKSDELIASPLPEKDIAELHEELTKAIEKTTGQEVSRNVQWAGYSPEENLLAYIPHDGGLYIYKDISPEDASELTNLMHKRKTTGENFIGAWQEGTESPIGAAMSKLVRKLQGERGGKGQEYIHKFPTIYHYLEPAIKLAKFKKRKRK